MKLGPAHESPPLVLQALQPVTYAGRGMHTLGSSGDGELARLKGAIHDTGGGQRVNTGGGAIGESAIHDTGRGQRVHTGEVGESALRFQRRDAAALHRPERNHTGGEKLGIGQRLRSNRGRVGADAGPVHDSAEANSVGPNRAPSSPVSSGTYGAFLYPHWGRARSHPAPPVSPTSATESCAAALQGSCARTSHAGNVYSGISHAGTFYAGSSYAGPSYAGKPASGVGMLAAGRRQVSRGGT